MGVSPGVWCGTAVIAFNVGSTGALYTLSAPVVCRSIGCDAVAHMLLLCRVLIWLVGAGHSDVIWLVGAGHSGAGHTTSV